MGMSLVCKARRSAPSGKNKNTKLVSSQVSYSKVRNYLGGLLYYRLCTENLSAATVFLVVFWDGFVVCMYQVFLLQLLSALVGALPTFCPCFHFHGT